ncbi:general substrate transporter [Corynespora cassiicola Philippines]|uniref:General substrate transporter n=1 Tax=Corynespora cassiicola Philippines TaxID=1448308 RepID=A0A2T2N2H9_CORCC|nr:general substrate transporter [Corynespora cassiicola Philippines]
MAEEKPKAEVFHHEEADVASHPMEDTRPWYQQPELRKLYLLMPFLFLGSTTLGYDGSLLNGLQTMPAWQTFFHHPTGSRLGLLGAFPGFGGFAVLLFTPYVADLLGRRLGTAIGCLIVILGAIIQAFPKKSDPDAMFLAGRFIMGMGSNISNATCPLLITEVSHPKHRGKITTIYNTVWYVGAILAAWTTFGTLNHLTGDISWRLPVGLQCAMPGVQLIFLYMLPESPRWLIAKNKHAAAKKILTKYHGNGEETDFVKWEFAEISQTLELEQAASAESGWYELVRTPGNRKRCLLIILTAIFSQCSGNGLVSYYLSQVLNTIGITNSSNQALINGGLTIWCWLVSLGCAFLVDRVGRRTLFLGAGVGMLIAFSIWTACSAVYAQTGNSSAGSAVLAMIFLFYGAAGLAWPGLTVSYTVEILPFKIRAKGLTLCFVFTSLSGIFNQYVNPIGLEALEWKFYIVYIVVLVLECLAIYFLYVETRGPTLEEIALLFDGENANVAGPSVHMAPRKASLSEA